VNDQDKTSLKAACLQAATTLIAARDHLKGAVDIDESVGLAAELYCRITAMNCRKAGHIGRFMPAEQLRPHRILGINEQHRRKSRHDDCALGLGHPADGYRECDRRKGSRASRSSSARCPTTDNITHSDRCRGDEATARRPQPLSCRGGAAAAGDCTRPDRDAGFMSGLRPLGKRGGAGIGLAS
jgi:hypothetical protein